MEERRFFLATGSWFADTFILEWILVNQLAMYLVAMAVTSIVHCWSVSSFQLRWRNAQRRWVEISWVDFWMQVRCFAVPVNVNSDIADYIQRAKAHCTLSKISCNTANHAALKINFLKWRPQWDKTSLHMIALPLSCLHKSMNGSSWDKVWYNCTLRHNFNLNNNWAPFIKN